MGSTMLRALCAVLVLLTTVSQSLSSDPYPSLESLELQVSTRFSGRKPLHWGENVPGVRTRLATGEKVIALTLDACGSVKGKGVDVRLIDFLAREQVPATLFINARWIDANPELFKRLAANKLDDGCMASPAAAGNPR